MAEPIEGRYIFQDARDAAEFSRLRKIERAFDPLTKKYLEALGLGRGARCLEVGPGAGSILRWMCEAVGETGSVTAADLNTRFIASEARPNLTVLQGDAANLDLGGPFDFIHARYVLVHVQSPQPLLRHLASRLKPGGWLVLEEPDFSAARPFTSDPALERSFLKLREAVLALFESMGLDPRRGAKLAELASGAGLEVSGGETSAERASGGSVIADMMKDSALHLKEKYLATGKARESDIENYCRLAQDSRHSAIFYAHAAVWARAPIL